MSLPRVGVRFFIYIYFPFFSLSSCLGTVAFGCRAEIFPSLISEDEDEEDDKNVNGKTNEKMDEDIPFQ